MYFKRVQSIATLVSKRVVKRLEAQQLQVIASLHAASNKILRCFVFVYSDNSKNYSKEMLATQSKLNLDKTGQIAH